VRNHRSSRVLPRALENANDAVVDCVARNSELPCSIATTTTTAISERTCCMHSGASERNPRPTVSFPLFPLFLTHHTVPGSFVFYLWPATAFISFRALDFFPVSFSRPFELTTRLLTHRHSYSTFAPPVLFTSEQRIKKFARLADCMNRMV
jgi:hypothetical protein